MKIEEKKNILIPIDEETQLPPLNKLIKLARVTRSKIHLAGFMSGNNQIDQLIKQTLSLTKKVNELACKIRAMGGFVSSKIYMTSFKRKIKKVIKDHQIGIITTFKPSNKITARSTKIFNGTLHLMLNNEEGNSQAQDVLILHSIKKDQSKLLATISKLFGTRLFTLQRVGNEAIKDIRKYFDKPLDPKINKGYEIADIHEWLNEHRPGLIAMKKEMVENDIKERRILNSVKSPVLLY